MVAAAIVLGAREIRPEGLGLARAMVGMRSVALLGVGGSRRVVWVPWIELP